MFGSPRFRRSLRSHRSGIVGFVLLIGLLVAIVLGPLVWTIDPLVGEAAQRLEGPSTTHPLGTDAFGRDVLSRLLHAGRASLLISLGALAIAGTIGLTIGLLAGFLRGRLDMLVLLINDALLSIPTLLLALALVAVLGTGIVNVVLAVSLAFVARVARVARASALSASQLGHVEAAVAVGLTRSSIAVRHVLPNVLGPVIVFGAAMLGEAIILEASMSFLGLGVALPQPSWGNMLAGDTREYFYRAPHLLLVPGLTLAIAVFAFNAVGDALSESSNPRLNGGD